MSLSPEAAHARFVAAPAAIIDAKPSPKTEVEPVQSEEAEVSPEFAEGVDISLAPPLG